MSLLLSNIALALVAGQAQATEPRLMRFPDVYGDSVAFTYAGDIWVSNLKGGFARRITSHPGLETRANFSPDGKWIAFTGEYDGNQEVYVVSADGGDPKRLTYEPNPDEVIGWTPDGKVMYTSTYGWWDGKQRGLYTVDPQGGLPTRSVLKDISQGSMTADGNVIAYNRGRSHLFNWRRYRGGTQGKVSVYDFKANKYRELTSGRDQSYFPMVVGNQIYYISDKKQGTLNLYRIGLDGGGDKQLTTFADADIRFPNTDGKTIVYERDGYLYSYDIASGKIDRLHPDVRTDAPPARPQLTKVGNQIEGISISPSGTRVAVVARGDVFSVPAKTGDTRNMTATQGVREQNVSWSPDARNIAYISDATGETEIYMRPQGGGDAIQLTNLKQVIDGFDWSPDSKSIAYLTRNGEVWILDVAAKSAKRAFETPNGVAGFDWSPDSKWIVYSQSTANRLNAVFVYSVATGKSTQLTSGFYNDVTPVFDLSGKYIYFVSARTFMPTMGVFGPSLTVQNASRIYVLPLQASTTNPLVAPNDEEPVAPEGGAAPAGQQGASPAPAKPAQGAPALQVDTDNSSDRAVPLPMPPGNYAILGGLKDGLLYYSGGALARFDLTSRESTTLGTGLPIAQISLNPARTKMAYYGAGTLGVVDVRPGLTPGAGRVDTNAVEMILDPKKEWKQIFWEAWRYERDNYYDPNMRGLNWKAIGDRYAGYLPYVAHRSDLDFILGLMLGELGTGHSYVAAAGPFTQPIPVGQLGADYRVVGGKVQIAKVYNGNQFDESRRGPLGDPGVNAKAGDYLLAIDGQPVDANTNPHSLLVGKVGRVVTLTLNDKPTTEGARTVRVRPVANEQGLRYAEWVEERRREVDRLSGGRIAYFHVPSTSTDGMTEFVRGFYSQTNKDALLVDERWNNGGFLPNFFVQTLAQTPQTWLQARNSKVDEPDVMGYPGPKAILVNQYAGSGGDMFPYLFRKAGLGPLIGSRTWGGLVGINGSSSFVDGQGGVTAPAFSIYDPETNEIVAENRGIDPDIDVDYRPDLVAQGRDPQLERAVQYLLDQLKNVKPRQPRQTIPRVGKEGQIKD